MGPVSDRAGPGFSAPAEPLAFGGRWFDAAAVVLLALGCVTGSVVLLVQGSTGGPAASPAQQVLQQRVRELEQRLLEQVPPAIERHYRDY